jgi:hypothetical protein
VRGLLLRLSELDTGMENAVRIIAFFDELVTRAAAPDMLVRSAAALAECTVGLAELRSGLRLCSRPGGDAPVGDDGPDLGPLLEQETPAPVRSGSRLLCPVLCDGAMAGAVWLEREDGFRRDDDLLVERFAQAAGVVLERVRPRSADPAARACLEALVAPGSTDEERAATLRGLGLPATGSALLLAVRSAARPALPAVLERLAALVARTPGTLTRTAAVGDVGLLLACGGADPASAVDSALTAAARERDLAAPGLRIGVGPALAALRGHESWAAARLALRFAPRPAPGGAPAVVRHGALGVLALLAHVPAELAAADPDVAAVAALAEPVPGGGPGDLAVLEAVCGAGSLREAAVGLHMHHSSVAHRIRRIERTLGYRLDTPDGRTRARTALLLNRLQDDPA